MSALSLTALTQTKPPVLPVAKAFANARGLPAIADKLDLSTERPRAGRLVTLPNGEPGLDLNGIKYDDYITKIMPNLKLGPAQKWSTWMIRQLYQGTTRRTVYKWFGNPCRYKAAGNLSCSEYTLMLTQLCGFKRGTAEGWRRINDEDPYMWKHPFMMLSAIPVIGRWFAKHAPQFDYTKLPTTDKAIPLSWIKDPATISAVAAL